MGQLHPNVVYFPFFFVTIQSQIRQTNYSIGSNGIMKKALMLCLGSDEELPSHGAQTLGPGRSVLMLKVECDPLTE